MIMYIIGLATTILLMFVLHELGHYTAAKQYGGEASIRWGGLVTDVTIDKKYMSKVYWWGIIAGFIPIFFWSIFSIVGLFTGSALLIYYVWIGCDSDFKAIVKLSKEVKSKP